MTTEDQDSTIVVHAAKAPKRRPRLWARVGLGLLLLSILLWAPLPALPFLPLELEQKTALGGGLFAGAEVTWWVGIGLVGPDAARRLRSWLRHH